MSLSRTPPSKVRRLLRKESNFVCSVPECENPYLEYHHFDPPWHDKNHHNAEGMIALCATHHAQADAGVFTKEQLIAYKTRQTNSNNVEGTFHQRRKNVAISVGGGFFYGCPIILTLNEHHVVWLSQDDEGHILLNINTPNLVIIDNDWITSSKSFDVDSPPNGKRLKINTNEKEMIELEFFDIYNQSEFDKVSSRGDFNMCSSILPLTIIKFSYYSKDPIGVNSLYITNEKIVFPGRNTISGAIQYGGYGAILYNGPLPLMWTQQPSYSISDVSQALEIELD